MVGTERREIFGNVPLRTICTSHVERVNLTTRTLMKRFTRLSLCFSKKLENLAAATAIYVAYYNFCWMHGSLTGTPAMAAKVASHPWSTQWRRKAGNDETPPDKSGGVFYAPAIIPDMIDAMKQTINRIVGKVAALIILPGIPFAFYELFTQRQISSEVWGGYKQTAGILMTALGFVFILTIDWRRFFPKRPPQVP
jgi:hypothetical protein